ncbi:MAG: hypothetical protein N3G20_10615, partial [Verrucomicrobiae bacterium]|nr:hypothetical protein [Verrucomicrobiae bacterium]
MKSLRAVGLWRSSVVVRAFRLLASDIARHAKCFRGWDVRSTKYTVPCQWWAVVLGVVLVLAVEARAIAE